MIVVDSSVLIAYRNRRDVHHEAALDVLKRIANGDYGPALLPEYVFLETVTVIATRVNQTIANETGADLLASREFELIPSSDLFQATLARFRTQTEARLSFTDCAILETARRHGAEHVATFDEDFAREPGIKVAR